MKVFKKRHGLWLQSIPDFGNLVATFCNIWLHKNAACCGFMGSRELKHVGRQHDGDGNQYNESMKINK